MDSARWPFSWTVWVILANVGCLFNTHKMSVGVRQHTQEVCGCPSAHTGRLWLSVCVCVCPSPHTGRSWLSINTHISTLVLGLSTLTLPVDCSGDFGPRGLSVQYTQDVRGCPSPHTGRPCVSVSTNRMSLAVCVCPSTHTGRPWLSISTHISTLVLGLSTLTLLVDCSGDFAPRELSVQYTQDVHGCPLHTQDVRGCPSVHISARCTHRTSVGVRQHTLDVCGCPCVSVCLCVCPSAHTGRPRLSISTNISTLFLGLSTLALPVECLGNFGPRGLSVQYTRRPLVSASTHRTFVGVRHHTQDVLGCLCVSVGVRQHTEDVLSCPSAHTGRLCVSVSTHRMFVCVSVSCSVHTGRLWMSTSTHRTTVAVRVCPCVSVSTHRTSVAFHQYTYKHAGPSTQHAGHGLTTLALLVDCLGRPWVSVSTHRTSVAVRVYLLVSISTHRTSVAVHQYTYQHVVHTGRPWVSVSTHRTSVCDGQHKQVVLGCPCVSVNTHRTSVAVHQYTYQHVGPWTQHPDPSRGLFG
ncbi:hypothetical protein YC2023_066184 [Brassica napus]